MTMYSPLVSLHKILSTRLPRCVIFLDGEQQKTVWFIQGIRSRMVLVVFFFVIFVILTLCFCFAVAIFGLVREVKTIFPLLN